MGTLVFKAVGNVLIQQERVIQLLPREQGCKHGYTSVKMLSNCFNSVIIVVFRRCTLDSINIQSYGHKRVSIDGIMYILIIFNLLNVQ